MPRQARIDAAGAVHHVIVRGIERKPIFSDNIDRDRFLERLGTIISGGKASCYAYALLPNHVHLLIRTGATQLSMLMRRLLTGYAVSFNNRHARSGHLFQNRYKSILCEEEPYFLQLVRYIHLNPLRVSLVKNVQALNTYPYSGHATIMGMQKRPWQDTGYVLDQFGCRADTARELYEAFVYQGIPEGRRSDLVGGGLLRSNRGWRLAEGGEHRRGDERILGSSRFVHDALKQAEETMERIPDRNAEDMSFERILDRVGQQFNLKPEELLLPGKYRTRVAARNVLCYILVRELGMTATAVALKLNMSQPAVSMAVAKGEAFVREKTLPVL